MKPRVRYDWLPYQTKTTLNSTFDFNANDIQLSYAFHIVELLAKNKDLSCAYYPASASKEKSSVQV